MQQQQGEFRKLYINKLLNVVVSRHVLNLLNSYGFIFMELLLNKYGKQKEVENNGHRL